MPRAREKAKSRAHSPKRRTGGLGADRPAAEPDLSYIAEPLRHLAIPIDQVQIDPDNLRLHDERNLEAIERSLVQFGFRSLIVVQRDGMVVRAGNGRVAVARKLGWTHLPALVCDDDDQEALAFAIADNRTAELASWDDAALAKALADLPASMKAAAGFTEAELREVLLRLPDSDVEQDAIPRPLPKAVARRGETWLLGEHRIRCGDSTDAKDVEELMAGEKADLVATDPPYLVDYTGARPEHNGGGTGKDWSGQYREQEIEDADAFFTAVFERALEVMAPHSAIYCWHASKRLGLLQQIWESLDILYHQQICWIKPASVFSASLYHWQHEPCALGWKRGSKPAHDGRHDHTTVWVLPLDERCVTAIHDNSDVWAADWEGKARAGDMGHPTPKPVELFARPMRKHTAPGDVCYEPFSGSGTQIIAAEQLGRRCYAMELEPTFVDVAIRRWQTLTGKHATLEGSKTTWTQAAKKRGVDLGA